MTITYRRGDSFLHSLDARTKLIMFLALTFIALLFLDPLIMGALFFGLYMLAADAVGHETVARSSKPLIAIFTIFSLYNLYWLRPEEATHLFYVLPGREFFPVTAEGLIRSVALFFRFFIVVLAVHTMLYTTSSADLVLGLTRRDDTKNRKSMLIYIAVVTVVFFSIINLSWHEQLQRISTNSLVTFGISLGGALVVAAVSYKALSKGLPPEIGITISLGFSTVGILTEQTQKIMDAQKARGYELEYRNPLLRIKAFAASLIPIFFATINRSENIAIAILTRAFDFDIQNRTHRRTLIFRKNDYVMLSILLLLIFAGLFMNYWQWATPTETIVRTLFLNR